MSTMNETKPVEVDNAEEVESRIVKAWKEAREFPAKRMVDYLGPTGIWIFAYYFSSLFMMIVLNIARLGWSFEAIFSAPIYFAQIFLNYGLNSGKVISDPLDTANDFYYQKIDFGNALTSTSWIFAPFIIYVLGIFIALLPFSGYPQPIGDFDYLLNFRYFHHFVPFLTERANGTKGGGFYFLIAWLPIILSVLISAFVAKRVFSGEEGQTRNINVLKIMLFNLLVGFIVGMQMGTLTGTVRFRFGGALRSIFTSSYENEGYSFDGQYNPNTILVTSWFINFIPMILATLWHLIYSPLEDSIVKGVNNSGKWINSKKKKEATVK